VGRFDKPVSWLRDDRFAEVRFGFAFFLEYGGFVGVVANNVGDVAETVIGSSLGRPIRKICCGICSNGLSPFRPISRRRFCGVSPATC
jgi:hypothetical protein